MYCIVVFSYVFFFLAAIWRPFGFCGGTKMRSTSKCNRIYVTICSKNEISKLCEPNGIECRNGVSVYHSHSPLYFSIFPFEAEVTRTRFSFSNSSAQWWCRSNGFFPSCSRFSFRMDWCIKWRRYPTIWYVRNCINGLKSLAKARIFGPCPIVYIS